MAHLDLAPLHAFADLGRQFEEPQQVADAGTRATYGVGRFLVREFELGYESLESPCLFERVEVLTLDVLDERDGDRGLVGNVADNRRNFVQARQIGRASCRERV